MPYVEEPEELAVGEASNRTRPLVLLRPLVLFLESEATGLDETVEAAAAVVGGSTGKSTSEKIWWKARAVVS